MTSYLKIRPATRKRVVTTFFLVSVILFCIYLGIFHLHGYNSHIYIAPILSTGVLCLYCLIRVWIEPKIRFFWVLSVLFVWGMTWIGILAVQQMQKHYYARLLSQDSGIVYGQVEFTGSKLSPFDHFGHIVVKYEFNNQTWRKKLENPQDSLHIDDVMKIKLATEDPDIIEVLKVYKK
jgi:hypothetical protein